jgi:hypothetical protein
MLPSEDPLSDLIELLECLSFYNRTLLFNLEILLFLKVTPLEIYAPKVGNRLFS